MADKKIVFATGNTGKMREIREILADLDLEVVSMKEIGFNMPIEENGTTFEENALIKARAVAGQCGEIVLADDSGLEIDYLNKEPGIYSARYMGEDTSYDIKNQNLIDRLDNVPDEKRTARFVCAIAAAFPDGSSEVVRGIMEGAIGYESAGENGFGYDPIFMVPEFQRSTAELTEESFDWLRSQCEYEKCVAVGEIGLDYYWDKPDRDTQKKWFLRQLDLARECKKPVVIHSRDAAKDTLDLMTAEKCHEIGGVIHCFSYTKETAKLFLEMGFYIGIGGVLTFKNARKLVEAAEYAPLDRIVLETDCPYLAPVPYRGRRNNSFLISYVITALAQIKGITEEEVRQKFALAISLALKSKDTDWQLFWTNVPCNGETPTIDEIIDYLILEFSEDEQD
mgnify:CR=1 FL=1